jgi:hypothetical protein
VLYTKSRPVFFFFTSNCIIVLDGDFFDRDGLSSRNRDGLNPNNTDETNDCLGSLIDSLLATTILMFVKQRFSWNLDRRDTEPNET